MWKRFGLLRSCLFLPLAFATVAASGCNLLKTQKQVYAEAKPAADALRPKLVAAAALVEKKPPTPQTSKCKATKPLTFDPASDAHNTDYMMLEEAKRGGAPADDQHKNESLDLYFGTNPFPRVMRGTNGFYPDYMMGDPAKDDFKDTVRRGLNVKNVVIVRELRTGAMDYFLVDLAPAAPTVVCAGTFTPTADPALGSAHTEEFQVITTNRRTGKVVKTDNKSVTSDPYHTALFLDAEAQLAIHMKSELGIAGIE